MLPLCFRRSVPSPPGSGSGLTLKGKLLMDAYDQFAEHLNREAQSLYGKFFKSLVEVT